MKTILIILLSLITHTVSSQLYYVGEVENEKYPLKLILFNENDVKVINGDTLPPQFTHLMTESHEYKTIKTPTLNTTIDGIEFVKGGLKIKTVIKNYFLTRENCHFLMLEDNLVVFRLDEEIIEIKK